MGARDEPGRGAGTGGLRSFARQFGPKQANSDTLAGGRKVTSSLTNQAGSVIAGRFRVAALLGKGVLAEVYEVFEVEAGRTFALKLFEPAFTKEHEAWESFQRTARLASSLPTPVIVRAFEFGFDSQHGRLYVVSERISEPSLDERVRKSGPLPLNELRALLSALGAALTAAHDAGIIHRELQPQNVFLGDTDAGAVRLSDFGVSVLRAALPPAPGWGGPVGWIGPDAAEPRSAPTVAMDIYSLGLLSFYALTGRSAFASFDPRALDPERLWTEMIEPIGSAAVRASELGKSLPIELDKWFSRALAPHPRARFSSVAEMVEQFQVDSEAAERNLQQQAAEPRAVGTQQEPTPAKATPALRDDRVELGSNPSAERKPISKRYAGEAPPGIAVASARPLALIRDFGPARKKADKGSKKASKSAASQPARTENSVFAVLVLVVGSVICLAAVFLLIFLYIAEQRRLASLALEGPASNAAAVMDAAVAPAAQPEPPSDAAKAADSVDASKTARDNALAADAATRAASAEKPVDSDKALPPTAGLVEFKCIPPPCDSVWCDGSPVADFQKPVVMKAGKHTCKALKARHRTRAQHFTVLEGHSDTRLFYQTKRK